MLIIFFDFRLQMLRYQTPYFIIGSRNAELFNNMLSIVMKIFVTIKLIVKGSSTKKLILLL